MIVKQVFLKGFEVLQFTCGSAKKLIQKATPSAKNLLLCVGCTKANWRGPDIEMDLEYMEKYKSMRRVLGK